MLCTALYQAPYGCEERASTVEKNLEGLVSLLGTLDRRDWGGLAKASRRTVEERAQEVLSNTCAAPAPGSHCNEAVLAGRSALGR